MRIACVVSCLVAVGLAFPVAAHADPCGLVPPVRWAEQTPIRRIGVQRTYVFYRNGLETLVLRPGFSGKVDEFGMLIPFPTPPAIRKMPDNVFEQITAAIDPPEVVVDLRPQMMAEMGGGFGGGGGGFGGGGMMGGMGFIPKDEVRVIRQEAVGMYEVAVLAAGSPKALKRWMDDHEYAYPSGMDAVCPEYVEDGWCFVAIKTKVKQKDAGQPRPGQRAIDDALPEGAAFDGHVQAMGFRFRTRRLVVPMRLSVHNPGDLRNIVYLLSDKPAKIRNIPEKFVVRQVSGYKLFDQLTDPLPLRIIGGTINDVPRATRIDLARRRDPQPRNGVAAELFASDIAAARTGRLENRSEVIEKDLLKINEALELRGQEVDDEVRRVLRGQRSRMVRSMLKALDKMTLTVIDGDFPRQVLARENLTFAEYRMPRARSNRTYYDANEMGPAPPKLGMLVPGSLDETALAGLPVRALDRRGELMELYDRRQQSNSAAKPSPDPESPTPAASRSGDMEKTAFLQSTRTNQWLTLALGLAAVGLLLARRLPRRATSLTVTLAVVLGCASLVAISKSAEKTSELKLLVARLGNPDVAEETAEELTTLGEEAVPALIVQSFTRDPIKRGWAIVCLGRIGGQNATSQLRRIYTDRDAPQLVRTWAAAAMVKAARSNEELDELSGLATDFPAVSRPILLEFQRRLRDEDGVTSIEGVLAAAARYPALEQAVGRQVLATGPQPLLRVMLQSKDQQVRFKAAGYLATLGQSPKNAREVAAATAKALKFDPAAKKAPWHGGPLYVPGIQWPQEESRLLVGNLIRWNLWAERHKKSEEMGQVYSNLTSIALARAAGYSSARSDKTKDWLTSWKAVVGAKEIKRILVEQGVEDKFHAVIGADPNDPFDDEGSTEADDLFGDPDPFGP